MIRAVVSVALSCCLALSSFSQSPAQPSGQTPEQAIKIRTNEVLLDVTVQDKKGRPVRDLRPEEIEVYEDGVKQNLSKFAVVGETAKPVGQDAGKPAIPAEQTATASQLNLVTLLIDHLPVQRVQQVRDAAFNFLDNSLTPDVLVPRPETELLPPLSITATAASPTTKPRLAMPPALASVIGPSSAAGTRNSQGSRQNSSAVSASAEPAASTARDRTATKPDR